MKEREREKGEEWGGVRESEREVERLKEKKSREKEQREKKRGREKQIGRRAYCRVSGCKINGGMLSFSLPAFTGVVMATGQNLPDCFLKTSPVLQVHRDHPDFAGRVRELVLS